MLSGVFFSSVYLFGLLWRKLFCGVEGKKSEKERKYLTCIHKVIHTHTHTHDSMFASEVSSVCRLKLNRFGLFQVFDATNTTPDRREVILGFAKENGYKVPCCPMKKSA